MPKVTSKLQLTVPKKIADQYGIRPGDELEWIPAGESIRVELVRRKAKAGQQLTAEERVALFDANMERVDRLQAAQLKEAREGNAALPNNPRVSLTFWAASGLFGQAFYSCYVALL
jgi:AbrB family looped-hinge helix DNA binding protein